MTGAIPLDKFTQADVEALMLGFADAWEYGIAVAEMQCADAHDELRSETCAFDDHFGGPW